MTTSPSPREWIERAPMSLLIGPIAWAVQLLIGYALAPVMCNVGRLPVYILSILSGLVILGAGVATYQSWRALVAGRPDITDVEIPQTRSEFLAVAGVLVNSLFFLLVVATGIFAIFLNPCPVITMTLP